MSEVERGRIGSSFDDYLDEEGIREEVEVQALKEVLTWQIEQEMKAVGLTKTAMARRMSTSRAQLARQLDRPIPRQRCTRCRRRPRSSDVA